MQKSFTPASQPQPYTLTAGNGLGIAYSSLEQIGEIFPSEAYGQGKCRFIFNVANGNIIIHDHPVQVSEIGGPLVFQMVYNNQADRKQSWRLALNS